MTVESAFATSSCQRYSNQYFSSIITTAEYSLLCTSISLDPVGNVMLPGLKSGTTQSGEEIEEGVHENGSGRASLEYCRVLLILALAPIFCPTPSVPLCLLPR